MQMRRKQSGFTIIELVVVILLLGILAATALPRFINVTDDAHQSVFEGTAGGFATGVAMTRAEWVASGSTGTTATMRDGTPVTVTARAGHILPGYPAATDVAGCSAVYNAVLRTGAPGIGVGTTVAIAPTSGTTASPSVTLVSLQGAVTGSGGDFTVAYYAYESTAPAPALNPALTRCYYFYTAQYATHAAAVAAGQPGLRYFYYEPFTGSVVIGNTLNGDNQ